jgi:hypothetical protein
MEVVVQIFIYVLSKFITRLGDRPGNNETHAVRPTYITHTLTVGITTALINRSLANPDNASAAKWAMFHLGFTQPSKASIEALGPCRLKPMVDDCVDLIGGSKGLCRMCSGNILGSIAI